MITLSASPLSKGGTIVAEADLKTRSTPELVLLILTALVSLLMIFAALGVLLVILIRPEVDASGVVSSLFDVTKVIVGAVVGYAAGYATSVVARENAAHINQEDI